MSGPRCRLAREGFGPQACEGRDEPLKCNRGQNIFPSLSRPPMDQELKRNLTASGVWLRGLNMLLMAVVWGVSEIVLATVVVLQFLTRLVTGEVNANLLGFGRQLSAFAYNIFLFLTFNTEDKPFPFRDWAASATPWSTGEQDARAEREIPALERPAARPATDTPDAPPA